METITTTTAVDAAIRSLRLARRGAAASAEGSCAVGLLDATAVARLRVSFLAEADRRASDARAREAAAVSGAYAAVAAA